MSPDFKCYGTTRKDVPSSGGGKRRNVREYFTKERMPELGRMMEEFREQTMEGTFPG